MEKISLPDRNTFCPQALYLYGTYRPDGKPNWGLFCWAAYCALGDKTHFVACIGEDKLTRDLIRQNGVFSATIVTQNLLAAADWCGFHEGCKVDKSAVLPYGKGAVLDVPVPADGFWTLELKVEHTLHPNPDFDSDIYVCSVQNVLADARLTDERLTLDEKLALEQPIVTMAAQYIPILPKTLGPWGVPGQALTPD